MRCSKTSLSLSLFDIWWKSVFESLICAYFIDVNQVRCHIEFNPDKDKAVRDRLYGVFVYWKFCFVSLNIGFVVKQQYNPLNALYFSPSQPHFHSCQKWNMALPWLKSIEKLVWVYFWMIRCISSVFRNLCVSVFPLKHASLAALKKGFFSGIRNDWVCWCCHDVMFACFCVYLSQSQHWPRKVWKPKVQTTR